MLIEEDFLLVLQFYMFLLFIPFLVFALLHFLHIIQIINSRRNSDIPASRKSLDVTQNYVAVFPSTHAARVTMFL